MPEWEDYYEILEVGPQATLDEIKHAYRAKALAFHPDRLIGVAGELRRVAEEKLKAVNRANEVLRDPDKSRQYRSQWLSKNSPPRPAIDRPRIRFADVEAGQSRLGSFVISNEGGSYSNIRVSDPDSWVRVVGYQSLADDELPLRIEFEALGRDPGRRYSETITVGLDDRETQVRVELLTRPAVSRGEEPETTYVAIGDETVTSAPGRARPTRRRSSWSEPPRYMTCAITGMSRGMIWAAVVGMVVFAVVAAGATAASLPAATSVFAAPLVAVLFGVLGAIGGAIAGAIGGALIGMLYGALTRS